MKQSALIKKIAEETGHNKLTVELIVNTMLKEMDEALKAGDSISFFRRFSLIPVIKKEREIYIPGTKTKIKKEKTKTIKIKVAKGYIKMLTETLK